MNWTEKDEKFKNILIKELQDFYEHQSTYLEGESVKEIIQWLESKFKQSQLTWQDIKFIAELYGNVSDGECDGVMGSKPYYELMLKKFNDWKRKKRNILKTP